MEVSKINQIQETMVRDTEGESEQLFNVQRLWEGSDCMVSVTSYGGPEAPRRASITGTGSVPSFPAVASSTAPVVFDGICPFWYFWRASISTLTRFCTSVDWG